MKKLNLTTLLLMAIVVLSSCSSGEDDPIQDFQTQTLAEEGVFSKRPSVKRNANGSYYLDYELNDGVASDVITKSNSKDINVYSSESVLQKKYNESLNLNGGDKFTIGINNTLENNTSSTITIIDNDIKFNRSAKKDHLKEWGMTDNGDDSYTLDFTVEDNIVADFVYNEEENEYEIKLARSSDSNKSNYSRTFRKEEGKDLEITFINYFYNNAGRTAEAVVEETSDRPRVIVQ